MRERQTRGARQIDFGGNADRRAIAADLATLRDDAVGIDDNLTTATSATVMESTVTTAIDDPDELENLDF